MTTNVMALAESFGVQLNRAQRRANPRVAEAAQLLGAAWSGDMLARVAVNEALTTSDAFARTVGDIFDREMLAEYQTVQPEWQKIAQRTMLRNFNPKKLVDLVGGSATLTKVPEHTNYPEGKYDSKVVQIALAKFGEQFGYTWEMKLADDLNELQTVPKRWAYKAQRTTDVAVLSAIANTLTGAPNTSLYSAANTNLYSGALTADNLQAVITGIGARRDADGALMPAPALQLVVGPALQFTAQRLLGATERRTTVNGVEVIEPNPFAGIPLQVMSSLPGDAWFVMPVPGSAPRPAAYAAFLVGHEAPQIRYKNDQGKLPSGADLGIDEGSFDDDTCYWRIRHVTGGASGDPTFTAAVTGGSGTGALAKTGW